MKRSYKPGLWPIATLGVLLGVGWLLGIARVDHFDGLYGQDPYAYYDYGQQVANLIAHGHGLGYLYWPLGYPALLGLSFLIGGVNEFSAQIVTIVCSAAAAVFSGLLTVEVALQCGWPKPVTWIGGVLAWALLLSSGQFIQSGIVVMADLPALMWATLSAWALARYLRTPKPGWIALAAFALAWATMTRWQYVALAVPWAIACIWRWSHGSHRTYRLPGTQAIRPTHHLRIRHMALAIAIGLLTSAPQIVYTLQNPDPALRHEWLTGWSPANAFARDFVTADGTFHYDQPVAVYYLLPVTSPYYLSVWIVPLIGIGLLALVLLRMSYRSRPLAVLLIGWVAVEYGFLIGIPYQNIRFALSFFPPLIVLAGIGVVALSLAIQRITIWPAGPELTLKIVLCTAVIGLSGWGVISPLPVASDLVGGFVANKDRDLAAVRWAEAQIPEAHATIYTIDLALTIAHYSPVKLTPVQIYYETPGTLAVRLPADRPAYALINIWTTEHQWPGKAPWIIYHWLLTAPGMDTVGTYGVYTLYRVR